MASAKGYGLACPDQIVQRKRLACITLVFCSTCFTASPYLPVPTLKLVRREVLAGHAPRLPSMARLATLLSWASSTQLESCLLCSTLAEAAAVQQDLAPRLKLTAPLGCLSFRHPAAGLQQHWQRSSAVRLQVQGMQRQVQPMQLSPIWSVVMVLASQPTGAAHPPIHTSRPRCAFTFACAVVRCMP